MNAMGENDIEARLTAAAQAYREHDLTALRTTDLSDRVAAASAQVQALAQGLAAEERDVDKLEHLSLTRVLASLRGARDDVLARERAEADAARYRLAQARAGLDALRRELEAASARLAELASAPATYAQVLKDKEAHLSSSGDPRGQRLLVLADERGRLGAELVELDQAGQAAGAARRALAVVRDKLGDASGWSTYDTFFGGGMFSSAVKHHRMDEAAQAAAYADRCIALLRTELADVAGMGLTAPQLAMDGMTRFVDVWFDNVFTDLAVRNRIKQAQENVANSDRMVAEVGARLRHRGDEVRARIGAIDTERHALLTE
jgi:hypothetical protein